MTDLPHIVPGKIGIVTVTYNSARVLSDFFDSLASQTYRDFELYVVDNASADETIALTRRVSEFAVQLIVNKENLGVAEGNNQGVSAALASGCEFVLLLNNDTVFGSDLIAKLRVGIDRYSCAMATPKIYYHDQPNVLWCTGGRFFMFFGYHTKHEGAGEVDHGQYEVARRIDYCPTCCLLIRREVFGEVGMMDSRYFVYSDDADFLYRCLKAGLQTWYIPEAKLWHKVSSLTGAESDFSTYFITRNHVLFLRKHLPSVVAYARYCETNMRAFAALMLKKIGYSKWVLRRKAAREGWEIGSRKQDVVGSSTSHEFIKSV